WTVHVADEAVIIDSAGSGSITKAERIAGAQSQKQSGARTNEAPALVWARMLDFDEVVVMFALEQPYQGQPFRATYVWVNRNARFQMVISYYTAVRDVPSYTFFDQPDDE